MRSASTTSSISAPPSSNGGGDEEAVDFERSNWLQALVQNAQVHTGFTTSEDSCSQHDLYANGPQPARVVHTGFTTSEESGSNSRSASGPCADAVAYNTRAVVHTGFTTSEDSGSNATSRSASYRQAVASNAQSRIVHTGFTTSESSACSSPSLSSRSSTAALFANAKVHVPAVQLAAGQIRPSASVQAAVASEQPLMPSRSAGALRSKSEALPEEVVQLRQQPTLAATAGHPPVARPLDQPRKADATPRRKVSPVSGGGGSHRAQAVAHFVGNEQRRRSGSPPWQPNSQGIERLHVVMPPSTLIDTQMRLDVLSDVALRVREEELQKELRRTRGEMQRRRSKVVATDAQSVVGGGGGPDGGSMLVDGAAYGAVHSESRTRFDTDRGHTMMRAKVAVDSDDSRPYWGSRVSGDSSVPVVAQQAASHWIGPSSSGAQQPTDRNARTQGDSNNHWDPSLHDAADDRLDGHRDRQHPHEVDSTRYGTGDMRTPSGRGDRGLASAAPSVTGVSSPSASRLRTYAQHLIQLATPRAKRLPAAGTASTPTTSKGGGDWPSSQQHLIDGSLSPLLKSPSPPHNRTGSLGDHNRHTVPQRESYIASQHHQAGFSAAHQHQNHHYHPQLPRQVAAAPPPSQSYHHHDANSASAALWSELVALRRIRET